MTKRKTIFMCALITLAIVYGGIAQANTINGSLYRVSEAIANSAIPANVPATADVTFTVNTPINFDSRLAAGDYTVGGWLGTGGASSIVVNTAGILTTPMDSAGGGSLLNFTGFVTVVDGQSFTVTHDDGLTLIIGGVNLGFNPGPTSPTTTTFTYHGASGNLPFQLVYGECCGAPSVLQVDLPFTSSVPEPATLLLLGLGLVGLAGIRRKI